ncbi:MAG: lipoyl(octanoyl) transferase LipB [Candidatus Marinimicrobia bacterium]|nr:lipoyl(octanoyl) transferase LipB [Candidatus Neomarinimicrobiota bacterium]HDN58797.1 lipoyl(octanoyl) transferase LipB [Candidatus Neomarinimicrobiota bacterium]
MSGELLLLDLGKSGYFETWELQRKLHQLRVTEKISDTLIFVEHNHVYTLGKNARRENLIASDEYLKSRNIEVYETDRGGDITYHGPGQLVGYPIFNLKKHKESISWFVNSVEEVLIQALKNFGIEADRIKGLTGVWVGNKKIAAIGMRVSKWVTMHGFALNVTTDLSYYLGIIPCGIMDKGITRMVDLNPEVNMDAVKRAILEKFVKVFKFKVVKPLKSVKEILVET